MEVKEAVKMAKEHIRELYEGEKITNLGLEEVELASDVWSIAVGFSRPWDSIPRDFVGNLQGPRARSYKIVKIRDIDGQILSVCEPLRRYGLAKTLPSAVVLDANLLVLLVVGHHDPALISKHRRVRMFDTGDYNLLLQELDRFRKVLVTPNTLTEISNLLSQHREPEKSHLLKALRRLIQNTDEVMVASTQASHHPSFERLGLTDAAVLEIISPETPLLTVDLQLYLEALKGGQPKALNFNHIRDSP